MSGTGKERMEEKPARLTVLIDAERKKAFEQLCAAQDITASQVVRHLIREYLARHGVSYGYGERQASGQAAGGQATQPD